MELRSYAVVLWRRKWVVVITMLFTALATAFGSYYWLAPKYVASATLWVPTIGPQGAGVGDIMLADRLINTYATLVTSRPVLLELRDRLGVSPQEARSLVSVSFEAQTELLNIVAMDQNPQRAADIATNLAKIVIRQTQHTEAGRDHRVSLFAPAGVPDTPSWFGFFPTPYWREINIGLGIVVGLIAGIGLAFVFEYVDTTLYTREQIESVTALTTLGEIPVSRHHQHIAALNGNTLHSEAFRFLRASIFFEQETLPQTLLVTSALPGEGKSTIVANLALAVAQSRRKVIVVDTDLRLPTLHKIFDLPVEPGLSDILQQKTTLTEAIQESTIPGIRVITSGAVPPNPAELLDSPQLAELVDALKQQTDLVLFDTPSLLAVSDAAVLAPLVDGTVLVVSQAQASQQAVQAARYHLTAVGARLVGIVVNRANQMTNYYGRYKAKSNAR